MRDNACKSRDGIMMVSRDEMEKQSWIAIAIPTLVVVPGFVQNNIRLSALSDRLGGIEGELVQIREKVWGFNRDLGKHDKAIEILEAKAK